MNSNSTKLRVEIRTMKPSFETVLNFGHSMLAG